MALSDAQKHVLARHPMVATLNRNSMYRENGHTEITGNAGKRKRVYDNDDKIITYLKAYDVSPNTAVPKHSPAHASGYHFSHFTNFRSPYTNIAHHLIPCEAFNTNEPFTEEELEILRRVKYDVNNGNNVIFLPGFSLGVEVYLLNSRKRAQNPGFDWKKLGQQEQAQYKARWEHDASRYCNVHMLPSHTDFHGDYSDMVKKDVEQVKESLREQMGKLCEDWKPPESIPREFEKIQDDYWGYVVRFGEQRKQLGLGDKLNSLIRIKPPRKRCSPG